MALNIKQCIKGAIGGAQEFDKGAMEYNMTTLIVYVGLYFVVCITARECVTLKVGIVAYG